jgi:hypothetical protein
MGSNRVGSASAGIGVPKLWTAIEKLSGSIAEETVTGASERP